MQVLNKKEFNDTSRYLQKLKDPVQIANNISSNLNIQNFFEKQELLELTNLKKDLKNSPIYRERNKHAISRKKFVEVKNQMEKTQREYYLNEQLKAIQKELGEIDDGKDETTSLNKAIENVKMPKDGRKKCFLS